MPYKVTRTGQFNLEVNRLGKTVHRLDEFIIGLEAILRTKPEEGKPTAHKRVLAFSMTRRQGDPKVTAYYSYTPTEVLLFALLMEGNPPPTPYIL